VASLGLGERTSRAAGLLLARAEDPSGLTGRRGGRENAFLLRRTAREMFAPEASTESSRGARSVGATGSSTKKNSPPPRLPVFSIAHRDRRPPQKLLRFRLRIGSQRCVESLSRSPPRRNFRAALGPSRASVHSRACSVQRAAVARVDRACARRGRGRQPV
jgi:hypothetical protein